MKTLSVQVPEGANELEIKMAIAAILFEKCILSSGQAAEFAGVTKRYFIENVGSFGVSIFDEDSLKSTTLLGQ